MISKREWLQDPDPIAARRRLLAAAAALRDDPEPEPKPSPAVSPRRRAITIVVVAVMLIIAASIWHPFGDTRADVLHDRLTGCDRLAQVTSRWDCWRAAYHAYNHAGGQ